MCGCLWWSVHHWLNLPNTKPKHYIGTQHAKPNRGLSGAGKLSQGDKEDHVILHKQNMA